jgi:hypothetical protein
VWSKEDSVNAFAVASIVLACVFGGALLGMFLRTVLPEHHLSDESKEVVKLVTGLVATLSALVLGLLIASAKGSFDTINESFRQAAAKIILLDRTLAQYGPETKELREQLRTSFKAQIDVLFAKDRASGATPNFPQGTATIEGFQEKLRALSPQNALQRSLQSRALDLIDGVAQTRWIGIEHQDNTIPRPFLIVLVFWLSAMFATFGLFAPRNAIAVAVLFVGALSLAAAIFLIEELNNPLGGLISVSRAPMDMAYSQLGK